MEKRTHKNSFICFNISITLFFIKNRVPIPESGTVVSVNNRYTNVEQITKNLNLKDLILVPDDTSEQIECEREKGVLQYVRRPLLEYNVTAWQTETFID